MYAMRSTCWSKSKIRALFSRTMACMPVVEESLCSWHAFKMSACCDLWTNIFCFSLHVLTIARSLLSNMHLYWPNRRKYRWCNSGERLCKPYIKSCPSQLEFRMVTDSLFEFFFVHTGRNTTDLTNDKPRLVTTWYLQTCCNLLNHLTWSLWKKVLTMNLQQPCWQLAADC